MNNLKRTYSEIKKINSAKFFNKMFQDIKDKFVGEDSKEQYTKYCMDLISQHSDIFDFISIEEEINIMKGLKEVKKIRRNLCAKETRHRKVLNE